MGGSTFLRPLHYLHVGSKARVHKRVESGVLGLGFRQHALQLVATQLRERRHTHTPTQCRAEAHWGTVRGAMASRLRPVRTSSCGGAHRSGRHRAGWGVGNDGRHSTLYDKPAARKSNARCRCATQVSPSPETRCRALTFGAPRSLTQSLAHPGPPPLTSRWASRPAGP